MSKRPGCFIEQVIAIGCCSMARAAQPGQYNSVNPPISEFLADLKERLPLRSDTCLKLE